MRNGRGERPELVLDSILPLKLGQNRRCGLTVIELGQNHFTVDWDIPVDRTGRRGGPEPEVITLETFGREIPED